MAIVKIEDYEEAMESYMGWCRICCKFTRSNTEPDAEHYDCPDCGFDEVYGAEQALLEGLITIEGRHLKRDEVPR